MPQKIQSQKTTTTENITLSDWIWAMFGKLWEIIEHLYQENLNQTETIQHLRDEIAILKGEKTKPTFKPSGMENKTNPEIKNDTQQPTENDTDSQPDKNSRTNKRPGSAKRSKTKDIKIHQQIEIQPKQPIPHGSRFKGYRDFVVQDLKIETFNTKYRLAVWKTPDGNTLCGELPPNLNGGHFGPNIRKFLLYQHHHCQVTQPLLHEQLTEFGTQISTGQINAILSGHNEQFFAEKDQILVTGLEVSNWITVDDTGTRHQNKNGYVTQIGNDLFAWFASTYSKSRINFLELLHAGKISYSINEHALDYMETQGLPKTQTQCLQTYSPNGLGITDPKRWGQYLDILDISAKHHRRIATEGALLGALIDKEFSLDLAIISDGAGQFAIFLHALCWVHAERLIHKLIPLNDQHREDQKRVRSDIWELYAGLKAYQQAPDPTLIPIFEICFDAIFTQRTSFETLNQALKRLHKRKEELLLVLKRPEIPLHTNGSERDIRVYVKWRKVSGGTRDDLGKQCRDTFASIRKTCRKLGISFWQYLNDRIAQCDEIPSLADIIRQRAEAAVP